VLEEFKEKDKNEYILHGIEPEGTGLPVGTRDHDQE
jgi:hypothetical protein